MHTKGIEYFPHPVKWSLWPSTAVAAVNQLPPCPSFLACRYHRTPLLTGVRSLFPALNWHIGQAGSVIMINQPHWGSCFSGWMIWESQSSSPLHWDGSISRMVQDAGGVYSPEGGESTKAQGRQRFLLVILNAQRTSWRKVIFILSELCPRKGHNYFS